MPTTEPQLAPATVEGAPGFAEPGDVSADVFGRRRPATNVWQPQDRWLMRMLLQPQIEKQEDAGPALLSSTEVSLEKVSLASGPTVIELTDEQAQHIIDNHGKDAFPPQ